MTTIIPLLLLLAAVFGVSFAATLTILWAIRLGRECERLSNQLREESNKEESK